MRSLIPYLLALTGGLLLPLAFSPFEWAWLAPPALSLLFAAWVHATPRQAFFRGYLFGVGQFGFGVSWVYNSMHDYGGANLWEAGGLTSLFVLILSFYPALAGWLGVKLFADRDKYFKWLIVFPACWVLFEWLRGWFIADFPWLQVGSSQVATPIGRGIAPLLGVYGVGWIIAMLSGLLLSVLDRDDWRRRGSMMAIGMIIVVCAWIDRIEWTSSAGPAFKAALLQGNVPQNQKWQPQFQRETLEMYIGLTRQNWDARLVIWPETAVPAFYHQVETSWLVPLRQEAGAHNTDLLIGIPWVDLQSQRYFNAIVSVGDKPGHYFKRHLVPFGEYLPFRPVFAWVLDILKIPLSDFARGEDGQTPIHAAGYPIAASICYEDVFGNESRDALPQAAYLVNVTNDAWFGDSMAPHQHVQMARMRALESGRYLLRATNSGVTAAISPDGEIIQRAPMFQQAVVLAEITPMAGSTPYIRFGDWPVILGLVFLLILFKFKRNNIAQ
jgi:apolipoprotein N-acyltransferase